MAAHPSWYTQLGTPTLTWLWNCWTSGHRWTSKTRWGVMEGVVEGVMCDGGVGVMGVWDVMREYGVMKRVWV